MIAWSSASAVAVDAGRFLPPILGWQDGLPSDSMPGKFPLGAFVQRIAARLQHFSELVQTESTHSSGFFLKKEPPFTTLKGSTSIPKMLQINQVVLPVHCKGFDEFSLPISDHRDLARDWCNGFRFIGSLDSPSSLH